MEEIDNFVKLCSDLGDSFGYGNGYGDGSGDGNGYGDGSGDDNDSGDGYGYGYGSGDGNDSGDGDGYGYGDGYGPGYGDGDGSGYGDGYGDDYGIKLFNGLSVYLIDNIQTIITYIRGNIAKGFILNDDLTLSPTFIVKSGNHFAHGKKLRDAVRDVNNKVFNNLDIEDKINVFKNEFKDFNIKIKASILSDWHTKLTGSCEQGKESFCRNHHIDINNDSFTINEFIDLVKDSYGGDIFKQLK